MAFSGGSRLQRREHPVRVSRLHIRHHARPFWRGSRVQPHYTAAPGRAWSWYDRWVDEVWKHCAENSDTYTPNPTMTAAA